MIPDWNSNKNFRPLLPLIQIFSVGSTFLVLIIASMRYQLGPLGFVLFTPEVFVVVAFELTLAFAVGYVFSLVVEILLAAVIGGLVASDAFDGWIHGISVFTRLIVTFVLFAPAVLMGPQDGSSLVFSALLVAPPVTAFSSALYLASIRDGREVRRVHILFPLLCVFPVAIALGSFRVQTASFGPYLVVSTKSGDLNAQQVLHLSSGWIFLNTEDRGSVFIASGEVSQIVATENQPLRNTREADPALKRVVGFLAGGL